MARKSGYYWVKKKGSAWGLAYWASSASVWLEDGIDDVFDDSVFDQINETRILAPDEVSDE